MNVSLAVIACTPCSTSLICMASVNPSHGTMLLLKAMLAVSCSLMNYCLLRGTLEPTILWAVAPPRRGRSAALAIPTNSGLSGGK